MRSFRPVVFLIRQLIKNCGNEGELWDKVDNGDDIKEEAIAILQRLEPAVNAWLEMRQIMKAPPQDHQQLIDDLLNKYRA